MKKRVQALDKIDIDSPLGIRKSDNTLRYARKFNFIAKEIKSGDYNILNSVFDGVLSMTA